MLVGSRYFLLFLFGFLVGQVAADESGNECDQRQEIVFCQAIVSWFESPSRDVEANQSADSGAYLQQPHSCSIREWRASPSSFLSPLGLLSSAIRANAGRMRTSKKGLKALSAQLRGLIA